MSSQNLFRKYDVPAPRYTSYPTVPYWKDSPSTNEWLESIGHSLQAKDSSYSIYIHVPFCETLCTFCGCNTSITKNHQVESPYVDKILNELDLYLKQAPSLKDRFCNMVHLGGGSPTFLSPASLDRLASGVLSRIKVSPKFEGSIEVDPRRTTREQMQVLRQHGFNRVSLGVQDFEPEVQRVINRIQPFAMTEKTTLEARSIGYESINFDLIYGLPFQTLESIKVMAEKTLLLRPDRIALYSFALVPWIKPQQRLFKDEDVPAGEFKRNLYEVARGLLLAAGYKEIGMDHFALETDALAHALNHKTLHRNFMGYTDQKSDVLLGLGVSAIGESHTCFHQNEKILPKYEESLAQSQLPTLRGHKLSAEDQQARKQILSLMTLGEAPLQSAAQAEDLKNYLHEMLADQLVEITPERISISPQGKPFLRNACMGLDLRLRHEQPQTRIFSQSV